MTGDQRHRNDITNGQHLNRHADRPYVFYFFPTAHFLKTILASPQVAHLALPLPQSQPFAKPKEPLLCLRTDKDNKTIQAKFDLNLRHTFFNNNYIQQQNI